MMSVKSLLLGLILFCSPVPIVKGQEAPPEPAAPKSVNIPAVREKKLANGLTVAVVERKSVPLVTIQFLIKAGARSENISKAGVADITASMLTKGTKTRSASQIAEDMEYLGGSIESGAGWNSSFVSVTVTSDKLDHAMAILSDVVLNPKFETSELDLLKSQTLDGLTYNLKQPGFLANYVASKYSLKEHPAGGTPSSIENISQKDISDFYSKNYRSNMSVLIFTGDITTERATAYADKLFGKMPKWEGKPGIRAEPTITASGSEKVPQFRRMLVVDLPNSGQAAVTYSIPMEAVGRNSNYYYPASVLNSVLGGGYSSRLNLEIRIKRGLSYGAASACAWRKAKANFATRTQTKNESAPQVVELVLAEIGKLTDTPVQNVELIPRKSVLTGGFGRNLETTSGLANALAELYTFGIPSDELNAYVSRINSVGDNQIKSFASSYILGGDIIIVGDYSVFKDDLKKRFPDIEVQVIKAVDLDLSQDDMQK